MVRRESLNRVPSGQAGGHQFEGRGMIVARRRSPTAPGSRPSFFDLDFPFAAGSPQICTTISNRLSKGCRDLTRPSRVVFLPTTTLLASVGALGRGLCLPEKDPLYPKCISPDLTAILIQKDDAKAQGIKSESTPEESGYVARPALVRKRMRGHPLKGVLSRQSRREILNVLAQSYPVLEVRCNGQPRRP